MQELQEAIRAAREGQEREQLAAALTEGGTSPAAAERPVERPPDSFMVVSYNMLCHSEKHLGHLRFTKQTLPWASRWANFVREFKEYDADVVCLQEVNKAMYVQLLEFFGAQGFEGLHIAKHLPEEVEAWRWDEATLGQAIFVRHRKFEILASTSGLLRDRKLLLEVEKEAKDEHGLFEFIHSRAEGVLCLALREVGTARRLAVACLHPTYHFAAPTWAAKCMQVALATRFVESFAQMYQVPLESVVLAGDFNSTPQNGGYGLLTTGTLANSHEEHPARNGWAIPSLQSGLGALRSAYAAAGGEPTLTTKTTRFMDVLDYIFVGSNLEVAGVLPIPPEASLDYCPNAKWPSDHLAVGAFLRLGPSTG